MEQTAEQIQQSIKAAFDSVGVLNDLNSLETLSEDQTMFKKANIDHLNIMMEKDWFSTNLTKSQKAQIAAVI